MEDHSFPSLSRGRTRSSPYPMGLPIVMLIAVALSLWKPSEWYALAAAIPAALLAASAPGRNRVRWIRAGGAAAVTTLALRHLLLVDQAWAGAAIALLAGILLWLALTPEQEELALSLLLPFGIFLVGTVSLEQRLFNTWPFSWLSVGATLMSFLLLARLTERRGSPWTYRGAAAVSLILGELFLALLFWPTTPAIGGAVMALTAVSALMVVDVEGPRLLRRLWPLAALTVLLIVTARWN